MSTKTEEIKEEIKEQPKKEKAPKEEKKDTKKKKKTYTVDEPTVHLPERRVLSIKLRVQNYIYVL